MLLIMQYRCGSDCARASAIREIAAKGLFTIQSLPGFVDERISMFPDAIFRPLHDYSSSNETKGKTICSVEADRTFLT